MVITQRFGLLPKAKFKQITPVRIILHDTEGPTLKSAEDTLVERQLGYHFMVDRDGAVYQYFDIDDPVNHAYKCNVGTIGISMIGGGGTKILPIQVDSVIELISYVRKRCHYLDFTTHKVIDPRGIKNDPEIPDSWISRISTETGVTFFSNSQ